MPINLPVIDDLIRRPPGGTFFPMPNSDDAAGFIGADPTGRAGGGSTGFNIFDPTSVANFSRVANAAGSSIPQRLPSLESIITQGVNSPLLAAVLGPALERLRAPQAQQQQQLTESTRAAGGLRGSQYTQGMNQLLYNQGLQTNDLMGQVIQQMLAPIISGRLQEQRNQFLPSEALINLLRAIRPEAVGSRATTGAGSSGWENIPPSLGLNTPTSPTPGFDQFGLNLQGLGGSGSSAGGGGSSPGVPPTGVPPPSQYSDPWQSLLGDVYGDSAGGAPLPLEYSYGGGGWTTNATPPGPYINPDIFAEGTDLSELY